MLGPQLLECWKRIWRHSLVWLGVSFDVYKANDIKVSLSFSLYLSLCVCMCACVCVPHRYNLKM